MTNFEKTNFEKIKQMSIDKMARIYHILPACIYDIPMKHCNKFNCDKFNGNCADCKKHWLESEVEENERY